MGGRGRGGIERQTEEEEEELRSKAQFEIFYNILVSLQTFSNT